MRYLAIVPFNGGTQIAVCKSRSEAVQFLTEAIQMIAAKFDCRPKGYVFCLAEATDVV